MNDVSNEVGKAYRSLVRTTPAGEGKWVVMMVVDTFPTFVSGQWNGEALALNRSDLLSALQCDSKEAAQALADSYHKEGEYAGANLYPMPWIEAVAIVAGEQFND